MRRLLPLLLVLLLVPAAEAGAVVGGTPADVSATPWMGQLETGSGDVVCGATLIDERAALTAAHCLLAYPDVRRFRVVLGRQRRGRGAALTARTVRRVSVHPLYLRVWPDERGDVALLWFDRPVTSVPPVGLADASTPRDAGTDAVVLGWGLRATGRYAPSLLAGALPLRSTRSCRRVLRPLGVLPNPTYELCAGASRRGRAMACSGDSGGPLLVPGADGALRQLGVVSWGDGRDLCRSGNRPGVFARLDPESRHRDWLRRALARGPAYRLPLETSAKLPVVALARAARAR